VRNDTLPSLNEKSREADRKRKEWSKVTGAITTSRMDVGKGETMDRVDDGANLGEFLMWGLEG